MPGRNHSNNSAEQEALALLLRYEKMLSNEELLYFDIEEFEAITNYYIEKGNYHSALKAISIAIEQHPQTLRLKMKKAQIYASVNKEKKALTLLSEMETLEPSNSEIYITKGAIYSQLNKNLHAIKEYRKAIEHFDERIDELYYNIASEYEKIGHYKKTIYYLKKCLDENPANESAIYEIALCYDLVQNNTSSIYYLTDFIDKHPYSKAAWFNLGTSYNNINNYKKAIEAYDYAIAIDAEFIAAFFNKAGALISSNKYLEAIDVYKQTFEIEEPDALTICNIAECYEKVNNFKKAIEYYKQSLALDNQLPDAWFGLGISFSEEENHEKALKCITEAIRLEAMNPEYHYVLGDIYQKSGQYELARDAYSKVTELHPDDPEIWLDYANSFAEEDDYYSALAIAEEGMKYQPQNQMLFYKATIYAYEVNEKDKGLEYFSKGLTINYPDHKTIFEYNPSLANCKEILSLLAKYNPENNN